MFNYKDIILETHGIKNVEPTKNSFITNKEWFIYEGKDKISVIFEDGNKKSFPINYHSNRGDNRSKWASKAARTWKTLAIEIFKSGGLSESGNPIKISWEKCFEEALKSSKMKDFILVPEVSSIFENTKQDGILLQEMTYDELLSSMENYKIRKGGGLKKVGDNGRIARSKDVKTKSLQVISTVGSDGNEYETSLFSFKTQRPKIDSKSTESRPRYQGFIKFLEDFEKGSDGDIQINCSCFSGNTLVLMSDGTYKPISKIQPGDFVYTHKGRIRPVIGNASRKIDNSENVYKINITGFPDDIIVTGSHPFYTLRGNVTCRCGCGKTLQDQTFKSLTPKTILSRKYILNHHSNKNWITNSSIQNVIALKNSGESTKNISMATNLSKSSINSILSNRRIPINLQQDEYPFKWISVDNFKKREWFLSPWLDEGSGGNINPMLARFLGYYAAEGCLTNRNDVHFCFNLNELKTLGWDSINIAETLYNCGLYFRLPNPYKGSLGKIWKICNYNNSSHMRPQKCFSITFHIKKEFKEFIRDTIGCGSHNKKLSPWFMSLNNETLKEFLIGLFLGDGTIKPNGHIRWTSVSHTLVYNASTILKRLKIDHSITNIGNGLAIDICHSNSAKQIFEWLRPYLRNSMLNRIHSKVDREEYHRNDGSLKVLRNIEKIDYKEEVWDLCVEEDHSFIVAGIAVANCPDYRYVWAKSNADSGAGITRSNSLSNTHRNFSGGENLNNNTYGRNIRNPARVPGMCKHCIALARYLDTNIKTAQSSAPTEKPVNIFEEIKQFAKKNPTFEVIYED
jgi:hypothetical protein